MKTNLPRVGIITRTKNRIVLLERAISSVREQSYPNWIQVIVNESGFSDEVDKLVESQPEEVRERIRVMHHAKSTGKELYTNAGIRRVMDEVELLIIHDEGDSWAPDFLKVAVGELYLAKEELPSIRGVITQANCVHEVVRGEKILIEELEPFLPKVNRGLVSLDAMLNQSQFLPIQFLYERTALLDVGLYRDDLPVLWDWEFNLRFLRRFDIKIIPQFLAFHHQRRGHNLPRTPSAQGSSDQHELYGQWLKNQWLREDLEKGITGLGCLANARSNEQYLMDWFDRAIAAPDRAKSGSKMSSTGPLATLSLLHKSGSPFHYVGRFFHFWRKIGFKGALTRARFWLKIKSGKHST